MWCSAFRPGGPLKSDDDKQDDGDGFDRLCHRNDYANGSPQISYQKKKKKINLVILYVKILAIVTTLLTNNCIRMK